MRRFLGSTSEPRDGLGHRTAVVASADWVPTRQSAEVFADLSRRIDVCLSDLRGVMNAEVAAFSATVQQAAVPAIVL